MRPIIATGTSIYREFLVWNSSHLYYTSRWCIINLPPPSRAAVAARAAPAGGGQGHVIHVVRNASFLASSRAPRAVARGTRRQIPGSCPELAVGRKWQPPPLARLLETARVLYRPRGFRPRTPPGMKRSCRCDRHSHSKLLAVTMAWNSSLKQLSLLLLLMVATTTAQGARFRSAAGLNVSCCRRVYNYMG